MHFGYFGYYLVGIVHFVLYIQSWVVCDMCLYIWYCIFGSAVWWMMGVGYELWVVCDGYCVVICLLWLLRITLCVVGILLFVC